MTMRPATAPEIDESLHVMALANHRENDQKWAERERPSVSDRSLGLSCGGRGHPYCRHTPHPTRLERSLVQFNAILGIYASALNHEIIDLPFSPPAGLAESVRERLS